MELNVLSTSTYVCVVVLSERYSWHVHRQKVVSIKYKAWDIYIETPMCLPYAMRSTAKSPQKSVNIIDYNLLTQFL